MLIGIISDTHENMSAIQKAVEVFNSKGVELVFHAGDIISPITFSYFDKLNSPIHLVFGNNDGEKQILKEKYTKRGSIIQNPPLEYIVEEKNNKIKFIIFHAPPSNLDDLAKSGDYDYIIYGHTHKKDFQKIGKTIIINPGEAGGWLFGEKTIAILNTETRNVEFVEL
ncbi:MAG: metallophosphoesterase [Endomicrobia bacterium]|nr:metallophosphoesterase [Endomicrobiia bacterium]